jgi:isoleucyl-tRNA synthetase
MKNKFNEYKGLDLSAINKEILKFWQENNTFEKSIKTREGHPEFVFYEGPPSANGTPGIHHVMARTIKDIFCRYKTLKGYKVERKAGWDTHGLPVEIGVEKKLGIRKDEIGKKISVEEYNKHCRTDVMKYTKEWEELTNLMGYWIDLKEPYITYENKYIETLWHLLKKLYEKGLLYKGYTIQPYSPAAGTGLSSHELNQPGCYRNVKDTTVTAQFKVIKDEKSNFLFEGTSSDVYILAWTTTPWTLPSNTALAVGEDIDYVEVETFNPYTGKKISLILAKDRLSAYFKEENRVDTLPENLENSKKLPYRIIKEFKGKNLVGIKYEQLIPWVRPMGKAFEVIPGDYVTTEDGTGIVHIAPTFGADDKRVAEATGIVPLLLIDKNGEQRPMVDLRGRFYPIEELDNDFVKEYVNEDLYKLFAGRFVKNSYDPSIPEDAPTLDIDIAVMLKKENKAFQVAKHEHSYPHCWRTDKPVIYYPLNSWFIKTTAFKDRMIELNKTINWKPEYTGSGRFAQWLENLVDWNLSRSRYWGTPLPIWSTEDGKEKICIGSVAELKKEIEKSIAAGFMKGNPLKDFDENDLSKENYNKIDLHRPYVDQIVLVSPSGKPMHREPDLIDVWFDSGAMPYAQWHYPFENTEKFKKKFPADFIAEGVDQTRGWFFTLHAIATMLFDSVAFKNIISNGLVLDKNGNKMSKRLGNVVDPFDLIGKYGADNVRWYMITNSQPWDNLKFDVAGVEEVKRKFFGTLYNTYSFFALYANIDGFTYNDEEVPINERPELDRWIISLLNTLIKEVEAALEDYEPTKAARLIQNFVIDNLSNWYVRLNRKRFWGGEYNKDKIAAYQTLYTVLETVAILMSPFAPFYAEKLYQDLNSVTSKHKEESVHLITFPKHNNDLINKDLEEQMDLAQRITSMILALRRKVNIKVRQPLARVLIPVLNKEQEQLIKNMEKIILTETNIKKMDLVTDTNEILIKKVKPNFKVLGPRYGKLMKGIAAYLSKLPQEEINKFEKEGTLTFDLDGNNIEIKINEVEIVSEDIPGWLVEHDGNLTVALDTNITEELKLEGIARELINKIQNIRKESDFEVTDKVKIRLANTHEELYKAVLTHKDYIASQTLAIDIDFSENLNGDSKKVKLTDEIEALIKVEKNN